MKEMSSTEAAYFAGIIDGEGTVTIIISGKGRKFPQLRPRIMISSVDEELLVWINQFGGNIYKARRKALKGQRRVSTWTTERQDEIVRLLDQIIPYLLLKKERAFLVKEFIESRQRWLIEQRGRVGYSDREKAIHEKLRVLNKRGTNEYEQEYSNAKVNDLDSMDPRTRGKINERSIKCQKQE